jgi:hypothetical protein
VLAREEEVESGRGDDDFGFGVERGAVEVVDYVADGFDGAVPAVMSQSVPILGVMYVYHGRRELRMRGYFRWTHILKLPPTKNWRVMIADCVWLGKVLSVWCKVELREFCNYRGKLLSMMSLGNKSRNRCFLFLRLSCRSGARQGCVVRYTFLPYTKRSLPMVKYL